jgi:hypothetical protein
MKSRKPPTGRERNAHLSVWILPHVLDALRRHCAATGARQSTVLEDIILRRCQ